ncbi:hypothetical protein ACU5AX_01620 [Sphingomonas sp. XXL09]|uniref:hypothetical protein n=1 Tax=Sphingomonas sp. XXL09 TaxID=3457787 RepID=UPI00406BB80F
MKTLALLALVPVTLAGCTHDSRVYPSLAPRAVERVGFAEPVRTAPKLVPDPALDVQIATLRAQLTKLADGFAGDARTAEAAASRAQGAAAGSDAWLEAQTALAQLDDWRAQTGALLTDVETRAGDRAAQLQPPYPALEALHDAITEEADRQGKTIDRLQDGLAKA